MDMFLPEYTEELFKGYEKCCNQEEITQHLQKVVDILKEMITIYNKIKLVKPLEQKQLRL